MSVNTQSRLVVGMTGASMPQLGIRLLEVLQQSEIETHLVISRGARRVIPLEASRKTVGEILSLATFTHSPEDLAAPIASGSFLTKGMVVIPCSMNTLAKIANGLSSDLISRAADVSLKESRRVVLVPRESPLHLGHLRNMTNVAEMGAKIVPPVLGSYYQPKTIDDIVDHIVGRVLDQFHIEHALSNRWDGPPTLSDQTTPHETPLLG